MDSNKNCESSVGCDSKFWNTTNTITLSNSSYSKHEMPLLGLGTFDTNPEVMKDIVLFALECGYRLFDCAALYKSEKHVGEALRTVIGKSIKRENLFITSKLPMNGMRREKVEYFLRKSLEDLQLDYIDLYLIHAPFAVQHRDDHDFYPIDGNGQLLADNECDLLETWKALEDCCSKGLVKAIGLSNFNQQQIELVYEAAVIKPSVLQVECHPYFQQHQLHQFCKERGIVMNAFAPLGSQQSAKIFGKACPLYDNQIQTLARKYEKTEAQILLRWITQRGIPAVAKAENKQQLQENIQAFNFQLQSNDMEIINKLNRNERIFWFTHVKGVQNHSKYPFK